MKIGVVGTGYVGLVTGTCFAAEGHNVTCIDVDESKVTRMQNGEIPIYEPGLEEIFNDNIRKKRLSFTTDLEKGVLGATAIFLALPTPPEKDGSADLSYILDVAEKLGPLLTKYAVIVDKSTVPVGTADKVRERVAKGATVDFDVVSNPEFLREGQAIKDFTHPDRVIIGTSSDKAWQTMKRLYNPFFLKDDSPIIRMSEASAEITKYAANAMLASRISFMNGIANICELTGADVREVQKGVGSDPRIGKEFLHAGPGYGGSCFPKDVQALAHTSSKLGYDFPLLEAIHDVNERQKRHLFEKVEAHFDGQLSDKTIALWGLAFKPKTDDVREAPALTILASLTDAGARVKVFDPEAMANVKKQCNDSDAVSFAEDEYAALEGADALVIVTDWDEFKAPDFERMKNALKTPIIFDGRSLYELEDMQEQGFHYESIGRRIVEQD